MRNDKFDGLLNEVTAMYANGHDDKYIVLQLAERGVDDKTIDELIEKVNSLRKASKKQRAVKLIIYGVSLIALAIIVSVATANSESPFRFFLWGAGISGVSLLVKGLSDIIF